MRSWDEIEIKSDNLTHLQQKVKEFTNFNPACVIRRCWTDKMNIGIEKAVTDQNRLGYGFVGDGYPIEKDQPFIPEIDLLNLSSAFPKLNYRDVGDAIYQANILLPLLDKNKSKTLTVVDFGAGYGRLAIPFIYWSIREQIPLTYIGVDFSPSGLLTASQFVWQAVEGSRCRDWDISYPDARYFHFVSLPAWKTDQLKELDIDLFITVHSFQEMEAKTIDFYMSLIDKKSKPLFYSVNYNVDFDKYTEGWELIFDRPYPINRDGSYNEKLWKV
jgi:SAM-dependent methyltransferase